LIIGLFFKKKDTFESHIFLVVRIHAQSSIHITYVYPMLYPIISELSCTFSIRYCLVHCKLHSVLYKCVVYYLSHCRMYI